MAGVFSDAFLLTVGIEGRFGADPRDRGNWTGGVVGRGELKGTKFGISAASYPDLDIEHLTLADAREIYSRDFWGRLRCDDLPAALAVLVFDAAVNCGQRQGAAFLQKAVGAYPDGDVGDRTVAAARVAPLVGALIELQAQRTDWMGFSKQWPVDGLGWSRRLFNVFVYAFNLIPQEFRAMSTSAPPPPAPTPIPTQIRATIRAVPVPGGTVTVGPLSTDAAGRTVFSVTGAVALDVQTTAIGSGSGGGGGGGTDSLVINWSGNPNTAVLPSCNFVLDGKLLGTVTAKTKVGEDPGGSDVTTFKGTWGSTAPGGGAHQLQITPAGQGDVGAWFNFVQMNGVPWYCQSFGPPNATSGWIPAGNPIVFSPTQVAVVPPPPVPTLSVIAGATINGNAMSPATLSDLLAATPTGGTLLLPVGIFVGCGNIPNACSVQGAGIGRTIIDATGLPLASGKAILVPQASGTSIGGMTLQGAGCPDLNGAGVRNEGGGIDVTLSFVEVTRCQMGVLTSGGNWTLSDCYTHENGTDGTVPGAAGLSQELYFNADAAAPVAVTLRRHVSTCGPHSTHALKCRAPALNVDGGTFSATAVGSDGSVAGSVFDMPDGGDVAASGATFVLPAGSANILFVGFGMESSKNPGALATFRTCVFRDGTGGGGKIASGIAAAQLALDASTYSGSAAPGIEGWGTVTGALTPAAP